MLLANWAGAATPKRIVSLDYCADQYLLKLADRENILAVSKDSERSFSYMRKAAAGLPKIGPAMEDILLSKADLVVWSYAGGPRVEGFLKRLGVAVFVLEYNQGLADVERSILAFGRRIGQQTKAEEVVQDVRNRLDKLEVTNQQKQALYLSPSGITAGKGTLVDSILSAAGLRNFEIRAGWPVVSLEQLVYNQPDLIVLGIFGADSDYLDRWNVRHHPIVHNRLLGKKTPSVTLPSAWMSCGGWFVLDAIEVLARAAEQL